MKHDDFYENFNPCNWDVETWLGGAYFAISMVLSCVFLYIFN